MIITPLLAGDSERYCYHGIMRRWYTLQMLKLIGILLFLWILASIDRHILWDTMRNARIGLLLSSIVLVYGTYVLKVIRWHIIIHAMGFRQSFAQSWRIYLLGLFFGLITPGKLGEFGRVAYLRRDGMSAKLGFALVILDRLADVIVICLLGIAAAGLLFEWRWGGTFSILVCGTALLLSLFARKSMFMQELLRHEKIRCLVPHLASITLLTLLNWTVYFVWAITIARSIHIEVPLLPLAASFVVTGILSMLPIAPSGLGTRDAALLTLLAPFGVEPGQAVALALLMFASIVLSGSLGGYYWISAKTMHARRKQSQKFLEEDAPFNS